MGCKVKFEGMMAAIFSVYDENMDVKKDTVKKLVEYQLENGLKGFYVGGNTGECTVLPASTRMQMAEEVVKANAGRGKVIVHVGAGHLDEVYKLIDHANTLDIDAIASLPPSLQAYYDRAEIIEYYSLIAKRSKHPVFAYVTSAVNGDLYSFAEEIAKIDNVVGLKISVPEYYTFNKIAAIDGGRLNIFNGPDETLICGLMVGADGAIGTTYNMLPKLAVSIYDAFKKGDNAKALELQRKLNSVITIAIDGNISYWKAIMTLMGFDMGYTVAPQKMPTEEDLADLKAKLDSVGFFEMI